MPLRLGMGLGLNRRRGRAGGAATPTGLLDSYTGAAVAFSLDTLVYGSHSVTDSEAGSQTNGQTDVYTVRVRRSSDNAVKSFTHTEVSDGTLTTWVGATNDGFVEAWYDQSGSGYHAEQSTAAAQPMIVDSGSLVTENGKAGLDFDGVDDILSTALSSMTRTQTYFVARLINPQPESFPGIISLSPVTNDVRAVKYSSSADLVYIFSSGTGASSIIIKDPATKNQFIARYDIDEVGNLNARVDNDSIVTGTTGNFTADGVAVGGVQNAKSSVKIQCAVLYPDVNVLRRNDVINKLNNYYNAY